MSKIMRGKSKLEEHSSLNKTLLLVFWATFIGIMYVYIKRGSFNMWEYILVIAAFAVPGTCFLKKYIGDKKKIKASEEIYNEFIKGSEEYFVLTNLFLIGINGKGLEIEYVVIGGNGVFVLSTKEDVNKEQLTLQVKSLENFLIRHKVNYIKKFVSIKYSDKDYVWDKIRNYNGETLSHEQIKDIIAKLNILQK